MPRETCQQRSVPRFRPWKETRKQYRPARGESHRPARFKCGINDAWELRDSGGARRR
jgi:hypothetical protein